MLGGGDIVLVFVVASEQAVKPFFVNTADEGAFAVFSGDAPTVIGGFHAGIAADALLALLDNTNH